MKLWHISFTDSNVCTISHPRPSHWGKVQVNIPLSAIFLSQGLNNEAMLSTTVCFLWWNCFYTASRHVKAFGLSIFFWDCFVVLIMKFIPSWLVKCGHHFHSLKILTSLQCTHFFSCLSCFIMFLAFVHSCFTEDYRRACLATAVQLLKKLCKGVKPESYTQNFPEVPVACMNVVVSVSDFVYCNTQQVCRVNCRRQDVSISDRNRSC